MQVRASFSAHNSVNFIMHLFNGEKSNIMGKYFLLTGLLTFFVVELFGQSLATVSVAAQNETQISDSDPRHQLNLSSAPNPFSLETTINIDLPESGKVSLKVFDILGQEVATIMDRQMKRGIHKLTYFGSELPAGRYYFRLNAGGKVLIRQVLKKN